jgi:hypothetical protein
MAMKKCVLLASLSIVIALACLASGAPPAFASTRQVTVAQSKFVGIIRAEKHGFHPRSWQEHTQYFHGDTYSHIHLRFRGHTQNNTGNQGHNRGYNQNFGANGGNLLINHSRTRRTQRTNQYFVGSSYGRSSLDFSGYNQNNSGNQGLNDGYNEDHGNNAGNQIVN